MSSRFQYKDTPQLISGGQREDKNRHKRRRPDVRVERPTSCPTNLTASHTNGPQSAAFLSVKSQCEASDYSMLDCSGSSTSDLGFYQSNLCLPITAGIQSPTQVSSTRTTPQHPVVVPQQICYGMIIDVPASFSEHFDMYAAQAIIPVNLGASNELLSESGNTPLGSLRCRGADLVQLLISEGIEVQLFCSVDLERTVPSKKRMSKKPLASCVRLSAILYGPAEMGPDLGESLQECDIYLQDPQYACRNVPYCNPQRFFNVDCQTTGSTVKQSRPEQGESTLGPVDILANFESEDSLPETEGADTLRTQLASHQKRALTFMLLRERGWALNDPGRDVWTEEIDAVGHISFVNNVVRSRHYEEPVAFSGGILADNMGLGKTLSIIALIAHDQVLRRQLKDRTTQEFGQIDSMVNSTLLIVPPSLLQTWEDELSLHIRDSSLKWQKHHGNQRSDSVRDIGSYDIVLTTFQTIASAWRNKQRNSAALFTIHWRRIVLDEAHYIRDASTVSAKAVCSLSADSRWAITGTPIQNRLSDLSSLLRYLRIFPYSDSEVFNAHITDLWKTGQEHEAIERLKRLIRTDLSRTLYFSAEERVMYNDAASRAIRCLDDALLQGSRRTETYLNALQKINELRTICNLGVSRLPAGSKRPWTDMYGGESFWDTDAASKAFNTLKAISTVFCDKCSANIETTEWGSSDRILADSVPRLTKCLRALCGVCYQTLSAEPDFAPPCDCRPCCRAAAIRTNSLPSPTIPPPLTYCDENGQFPTKVRALIHDLQSLESDIKSIVFSSWTSTLDIVEVALQRYSITSVRFDGQVSQKKRAEALSRFRTDAEVKVVLLSLSCGAVGLNLTTASRAYLMEPHWNPTVEEQALARIHRLGQMKEVTTIRYIMDDTVEKIVTDIQGRKRHLANILLSSGRVSESDLALSQLYHLRLLLE